jgi:hypothetical protein
LVASQATDSSVNTVRDGILQNYNTTTVGKAFEGTFQHPKWHSLVTPTGETVVEFNGTVTFGALNTHELDWVQLFSNSVLFKTCPNEMKEYEALLQRAKSNPEYWRKAKTADAMACQLPVTFQFSLSADKSSFQVMYIDKDVFQYYKPESVLNFIFTSAVSQEVPLHVSN